MGIIAYNAEFSGLGAMHPCYLFIAVILNESVTIYFNGQRIEQFLAQIPHVATKHAIYYYYYYYATNVV